MAARRLVEGGTDSDELDELVPKIGSVVVGSSPETRNENLCDSLGV
jgi:hypothetical protein